MDSFTTEEDPRIETFWNNQFHMLMLRISSKNLLSLSNVAMSSNSFTSLHGWKCHEGYETESSMLSQAKNFYKPFESLIVRKL